jgi:predicted RNA-binding Zn-ribbon protein involved in translation (DUF1610 family)
LEGFGVSKITKKAKRVDLFWTESISYHSSYTCPACKAIYRGFVSGENVTRFKCNCGQELIVNKNIRGLK